MATISSLESPENIKTVPASATSLIYSLRALFVDGDDGDIIDPFFHPACAEAFHMASTARLESFDAP